MRFTTSVTLSTQRRRDSTRPSNPPGTVLILSVPNTHNKIPADLLLRIFFRTSIHKCLGTLIAVEQIFLVWKTEQNMVWSGFGSGSKSGPEIKRSQSRNVTVSQHWFQRYSFLIFKIIIYIDAGRVSPALWWIWTRIAWTPRPLLAPWSPPPRLPTRRKAGHLSDNILQLAFLFSSFLAQNAQKNLYWWLRRFLKRLRYDLSNP